VCRFLGRHHSPTITRDTLPGVRETCTAADARAPTSAFAPIPSAVPLGADPQDGRADGLFVTLSGHKGLAK
jgi:hypothetical protein